jgi:hypothetical protein
MPGAIGSSRGFIELFPAPGAELFEQQVGGKRLSELVDSLYDD